MKSRFRKQVLIGSVCFAAVCLCLCFARFPAPCALAAGARKHRTTAAPQRPPVLEFRAIPPRYAKGENGPVRDGKGNIVGFLDSVTGKMAPVERALRESKVITTSRYLKPNSEVKTFPGQGAVVTFELQDTWANRFSIHTAQSIGQYLAIVVNGKMITCPQIRSSIPGKGVIESQAFRGPRGLEEARKLAKLLNEDALRSKLSPKLAPVAPSYEQRVRACRDNFKIIETGCQAYFAQNKAWPKRVTDMVRGGTAPRGARSGQLVKIPVCPFGKAYPLVSVHEDPSDPASPVVGKVVDWHGHWPEANWMTATEHRP